MLRSATIVVGIIVPAEVPRPLWRDLTAILSESERMRAMRFRLERNQQEYIAAHVLKRLMLCELAGGAPKDWSFTVEPGGKPLVAGTQWPYFNISHCDGLVACAVSPDVPLGVDVERVDRPAPLDVTEYYLAADELNWLSGLPESERSRGFLKLWTMKEAYVKATGQGIIRDLSTFTIAFDPLRVINRAPSQDKSESWHLLQLSVREHHFLGLAWRGRKAKVHLKILRLRDTSLHNACADEQIAFG